MSMHPHSQKFASSQKGVRWPDFLSKSSLGYDGLEAICRFVTRQSDYEIKWLDADESIPIIDGSGSREYKYAVGQSITVEYMGHITYVSLTNPEDDGRNSYFQAVGPAYNRYLLEKSKKKSFLIYALKKDGLAEDGYGKNMYTNYRTFYWKLLYTAGLQANWEDFFGIEPSKFKDFLDLSKQRNAISKSNNNPSYVYFDEEVKKYRLYLKTYGTNKYESLFFAVASINLAGGKGIEISEIEEGKLVDLPKWVVNFIIDYGSRPRGSIGKVLAFLGFPKRNRVTINSTGMEMDDHKPQPKIFPPSLRGGHRKNVMQRLGEELCSFCEEDVESRIQAAHVFDVHEIKKSAMLGRSDTPLWEMSNNSHNGFWLCKSHHTPFDSDILAIDEKNGDLLYRTDVGKKKAGRLRKTITKIKLDKIIFSTDFKKFLKMRNERLINRAEQKDWRKSYIKF